MERLLKEIYTHNKRGTEKEEKIRTETRCYKTGRINAQEITLQFFKFKNMVIKIKKKFSIGFTR